MTANNPSWGLFVKTTVPGTTVSCLLVIGGYYYFTTPKDTHVEVLPWLVAQAHGVKYHIRTGYDYGVGGIRTGYGYGVGGIRTGYGYVVREIQRAMWGVSRRDVLNVNHPV